MDLEFNSLVNKVEVNLGESKERRIAMARNKLIRINLGLQSLGWGEKEYPGIKGSTTLDELKAFLKKEKERTEKEIRDNGGKP